MNDHNIKVDIVERREVSLPFEEAKKVTQRMIRYACGIPEGAFIEDDHLCHNVREGGGSHSWIETIKIREATPRDRQALAILEAVRGSVPS